MSQLQFIFFPLCPSSKTKMVKELVQGVKNQNIIFKEVDKEQMEGQEWLSINSLFKSPYINILSE